MSPLLKPRPSSPPRRSPDDTNTSVKLSPWHLMGLGLVALIGTGIVAAVDRSQERAASSQVSSRPAPAKSEAPVARAPDTSSTASIQTARAPAPADIPATTEPARSQVAAIEPGRDNRSVLIAPAEAAGARFAASPPATLPYPFQSPPERTPSASEGPASTASLTTPAPPVRPPAPPEPQAAPANGAVKTSAAAPLDCLPQALRAVLDDVAGRFGPITVVSTHQLTTVNHSSGSIREKLHHDCKAVDIRPERGRLEEIKAYLRGRREIVGLESYRNGIIHMDVSGGIVTSTRAPRRQSRRRAAEASVKEIPMGAPAPAAPSTAPLTPAVRDRGR